jgi:hypothetical protein
MDTHSKRGSQIIPFVDDMILCLRVHQKTLDLVSTFGKVAGYKVNLQKSVALLYTNNKKAEKEISRTIPFTIASKYSWPWWAHL